MQVQPATALAFVALPLLPQVLPYDRLMSTLDISSMREVRSRAPGRRQLKAACCATQHDSNAPAPPPPSPAAQLEDFLIAHCFYPGALRGKLDQSARSLQVHHAVSRDVRPQQLPQLAAALGSW